MIAIEQIQNLFRVLGRRSVVNCDPDFFTGSLKRTQDRTPPLRMRNERWIKYEKMRNEQRNERCQEVDLKENNCPDWRDDGEGENT